MSDPNACGQQEANSVASNSCTGGGTHHGGGGMPALRHGGRLVVTCAVCAFRRGPGSRALDCRSARCVVLSLLWLQASTSLVLAEPAHFWLSPSNTAPAGPEAPTIQAINGGVRQVHIWAQPATVGSGPFNEVSNPFKRLSNISLNLVTDQPVVDLLDDQIVVHNPLLDATTRRFEFVHDSSTLLESSVNAAGVAAGTPDRIDGLKGFSISSGGSFSGIGPVCDVIDPYCAVTGNGSPAWLIASLAFRTVQDSGTANYFLQIGSVGMNHAGEDSATTSVVFGFDPAASEPVYNALSNRSTTFASDDADLVVEAFPPPPGDYSRNGFVDAADYVVWRKSLGQIGAGLMADGTGPLGAPDGVVDALDYEFWTTHFGETAFAAAGSIGAMGNLTTVPEPSGLICSALPLLSPIALKRRRQASELYAAAQTAICSDW